MPLTRDDAEKAVEKLRSYAQPQRLMILSQLQAGEMTVSEIDAATGIGQPALSQQLGELRRAGLVATRRAARQVFYQLANAGVALCVRSIEAQFGAGASAPFVAGEGASPPASPAETSAPPSGSVPATERSAAMFARIVRPGEPAV